MTYFLDDGHPDRVAIDELLRELGAVNACWNHVEAVASLLLSALTGAGWKTDVLASGFSQVALIDAVRTMAAEFGDAATAPLVGHSMEYMDRVREFRNFYIHGIRLFARQEDTGVIAMAQNVRSKNVLKIQTRSIQKQELTECIGQLRILDELLSRIVSRVYGMKETVPYQRALSIEGYPLPAKIVSQWQRLAVGRIDAVGE